jgi:hypothetical protein
MHVLAGTTFSVMGCGWMERSGYLDISAPEHFGLVFSIPRPFGPGLFGYFVDIVLYTVGIYQCTIFNFFQNGLYLDFF